MTERERSGRHRWLDALDRAPDWSLVGLTALILAVSYVIVAVPGADASVTRHLFYVPIVLAAVRFGALAGGGTALLATLLAGPLAADADPMIWLGRGAAFVLIGAIVGAFSSARGRAVTLERDVADRERALVAERAALVQIISHELRTPLTILRGSVETLLERDALASTEGRELVLAMQRAVGRLQDMVEVTLAAADDLEIDLDAQEHLDVADLVEHAVSSLPPRLRQRLVVDIPPGASLVATESQLWLTLRCLLDNADKFSPDDGVVRVRYLESEGLCVIRVEDDGPGLPAGFGDAAFEPFVQADATERRSHPGLGMGLYTARRLARRMGGDVVLTSRDRGHGGLAEVRLPRSPVSAG